MKKQLTLFLVIIFILFAFINANAKTLNIARDKSLLKDGPGNFYDTITVLKLNTKVQFINESKEDPGWMYIAYGNKKGYISKMALRE